MPNDTRCESTLMRDIKILKMIERKIASLRGLNLNSFSIKSFKGLRLKFVSVS